MRVGARGRGEEEDSGKKRRARRKAAAGGLCCCCCRVQWRRAGWGLAMGRERGRRPGRARMERRPERERRGSGVVAAAAVGWQLREGRVACVCHSHIYIRVQIDLQHPRPCPPPPPHGPWGAFGGRGGGKRLKPHSGVEVIAPERALSSNHTRRMYVPPPGAAGCAAQCYVVPWAVCEGRGGGLKHHAPVGVRVL